MEYTINKLATLAGVTTRTLRYYDQIALLTPSYTNQSGYRIYGQKEVDKLQQILFFRELDLSLEQIATILNQPDLDYLTLLSSHREALVIKKQRLTALIKTIDSTIAVQKGEIKMTDTQKFDAFKQQLVTENETKYGTEIRGKYGNEQIDASNAALMNMTAEDYQTMQTNEQQLLTLLADHSTLVVPSEKAAEIFNLHKKWLTQAWSKKKYSRDTHKGLAEMYVAAPEFTAYYDSKAGEGATQVLNTIIQYYA
ncbi:MerR family transcriptional regulator [Vagococcus sp. BWB3-3]|uniref:MerR family transcriptional regulator n=1 Tax=Vagococcus allomyrinae TaxID=2794353 RepID=A0A940PEK8_9ENTE|nr:MerR family transcriptional regulator [Vagococcus allomyrinae]MBP1043157.1 MerR family transcriptional regulator [Vagococcus allomyrinae]